MHGWNAAVRVGARLEIAHVPQTLHDSVSWDVGTERGVRALGGIGTRGGEAGGRWNAEWGGWGALERGVRGGTRGAGRVYLDRDAMPSKACETDCRDAAERTVD